MSNIPEVVPIPPAGKILITPWMFCGIGNHLLSISV